MTAIGSQNKMLRIELMNGGNLVFQNVWTLEPDVQVPTFHPGELMQITADAGRFQGNVDTIRHEIMVGSGNITFVTTIRSNNAGPA